MKKGASRFAKKDKPEPRPPTPDDVFLDELRHKCAEAIVEYLKNSVDVRRTIKSLTLSDFKGMAEACTARWIVVVSRKLMRNELEPETAKEYHNLLMG